MFHRISILPQKLIILFLLLVLGANAQELPPVITYNPNEYAGGNQNWMISQGENKNFYFANGSGLLEFTGEKWNLYPVSNKTIVRSVKAVADRIYTGAYMEAGYWKRDDLGILRYTSLREKFAKYIQDGEQFWSIESQDGIVIFRSFEGIYFYNPQTDTVETLANPEGQPFSGLFRMDDRIFFQMVGKGLYEIRTGTPKLIIPFAKLNGRAIVYLFQNDGQLNVIFNDAGVYEWKGEEFEEKADNFLNETGPLNVLAAVRLSNGDLILGTVGKGILRINAQGELINTFNQSNVLLNNTALNLFLDENENVWAGLDYGLSMIDFKSGFSFFKDIRGEIGSVYSSLKYQDSLYLATNQGLYVKAEKANQFRMVEGTGGQVWNVDQIEGTVFCSHNNGTFVIKNGKAYKLCDRLGTWMVKKLNDSTYIQGHYNGISFIKQKADKFTCTEMMKDFSHSSKYIEISEGGREIWVSNEHKGIFRIRLKDSLPDYEIIKNYTFPEESGITSSIFRFNGDLYYSSKENIYKYNSITDEFIPENELKGTLDSIPRISGRMITGNNGKILWGFGENSVFSVKPSNLSNGLKVDLYHIHKSYRNIANGYENISELSPNENLLGIANGYIRFEGEKKLPSNLNVSIDKITASSVEGKEQILSLHKPADLSYRINNIEFQFSLPLYKQYLTPEYSYRLKGLSNSWSEWQEEGSVSFKNLRFGDYIFEVRSRYGDNVTPVETYKFEVERPYYLNNFAIVLYIFILILILVGIHFMYKRNHAKAIAENERNLRMKNLEAEQKIIKLQNERLEQDMANKNRELAVSTMSLIKKNEFLNKIKERLKDQNSDSRQIKSVIKTIDEDINEEDNWNFFKKAFNNADKDFLKKMKAAHPDLTSSDLKLCAYLRLNLSSKEIAPLLNISTKSVEIKRYRLRKKMDLDRNVNLTDYILSV